VSVDEFARRGGEAFERIFNIARVVLMFVLGCGLIIYSVVDQATNLAYIIVGAVLIGLVPVDQWLTHVTHTSHTQVTHTQVTRKREAGHARSETT
jgi:hypothetical protein